MVAGPDISGSLSTAVARCHHLHLGILQACLVIMPFGMLMAGCK